MSDSDSIFESKIKEQDGICRNCYRRTHEVREAIFPTKVKGRPITGTVLRETEFERISDNTSRVYPPGTPAGSYPAARSACVCGAIDGDVSMTPMSKEIAIQLTQHVEERLEELDLEFDSDTLYQHVRQEKSKEDRQHEDEEIFEEAVEKAVRLADND